jgi:hypothetical protein
MPKRSVSKCFWYLERINVSSRSTLGRGRRPREKEILTRSFVYGLFTAVLLASCVSVQRKSSWRWSRGLGRVIRVSGVGNHVSVMIYRAWLHVGVQSQRRLFSLIAFFHCDRVTLINHGAFSYYRPKLELYLSFPTRYIDHNYYSSLSPNS